MPFTFAHPAAVLPLLRHAWFVPAALVIGAMVPDAEYFVLLRAERTISHTPLGVFVQGLPVGLALYALWTHLWWVYLVELWPWARRVVGDDAAVRWTPTLGLRVAASVVLGAFTHLLWDAATHEHGALVERVSVLSEPWLTLGAEAVSGYRVLQHGSTLVGFAALAVHAVVSARRRGHAAVGHANVRVFAALTSIATAATCTALAHAPGPHSRADLVHAALAGISAFIAAFTAGAIHWRWRSRTSDPG